MRFLRQNQYLLCFLGVLVLAAVMVLREIAAAETAHIQRREDFLLLHERGQKQPASRLYQVLIQEMPGLSDRTLALDLQRTAMIVNPQQMDLENLVWKFHISIRNELHKRAERRIASLVEADPQ